jgi:hypothetical protein
MKLPFAAWTLVALAAVTGCTPQGTPGGVGSTGKNPTIGQAEDTFNLTVPMLSTTLQQGQETAATIGIKRATNFDEDVSLSFAEVPKGVSITPSKPVIKRGDADTKVVLKTDDTAPLGDFKIKVSGHPTNGADAQIEFKVSVVAMDTFELDVPLLSTSLTQGETKSVAIGISRDKTFVEDVVLEFLGVPTGVSLDPKAPVIKNGEAEAKVTLTAADDAALGDFAIKVIGQPTKGPKASNEFKITVSKK